MLRVERKLGAMDFCLGVPTSPTLQDRMSSLKCESMFCVQIRGGVLGSW